MQQLGRAAVIVEPRMPAARRDAIVADAGAAVLVTLADGADAAAPTLTALPPGRGSGSSIPPIRPPDRPALVLYTSGSTGTPNGVVYSERAILDRIVERDRFALGPGAARRRLRRRRHESLPDAAARGGAGVVGRDAATGIAGVADWIAREELTVLHCLPTLFRRLTDTWERAARRGRTSAS